MVLMVGLAFVVVRMGEAMRVGMGVGAVFGAAGVGWIVHADEVARAGRGVNRAVIA
jgi:hypothetical protein